MKQIIAVLLLFVSINAQAKGLMMATSTRTESGAGIFFPPSPETSKLSNVWTDVVWKGQRNGTRAEWTGSETHFVQENDPRIEKHGDRYVGFINTKREEGTRKIYEFDPYLTFDDYQPVTAVSIHIRVNDQVVSEEYQVNASDIEFVPNLVGQTNPYSSRSRLQLAFGDQVKLNGMIAEVLSGLGEEQLAKVDLRMDFQTPGPKSGQIHIHQLKFSISEAEAALGLKTQIKIRKFSDGQMQIGDYFGRRAVILYSKSLLIGASRISDYVLLRPDQVPADLLRAMLSGSVPIQATVKLIPGLDEPWGEVVSFERRDCPALLGE